MNPDSKPDANSHPRKVNWEMLLPGLLFTAFASYISYAIFWSHQQQEDAARNYQPVVATILDSKVVESRVRDAATGGPVRSYQPLLRYQYQVDGRLYQSSRFSYLGPANSSRDTVQAIVESYPVGSQQTAYVNPSDPQQAVLQRSQVSVDLMSGYFWVPTVMVAVGLLLVFGGWRGWGRGLRQVPGART
jgi:hypothetical protein